VLVRAQPLSAVAVYPRRSVPATVVSLNDSQVSAEIRAPVEQVHVLVGDLVSKGDLLISLDCRDYRLALRQTTAEVARARSSTELARKQHDRSQSLSGRQQISEELLDQRQTELALARQDLALAQTRLEQAQLNVERCSVRAPFAGVITERLANIGQLAAIGTPLLRILDNTQLEVTADVPVDGVAPLSGSTDIWLQANGNRQGLTLRAITPVIDPKARSVEARFVFKEERALPGTAGRVMWQAAVLHVPAELVVERGKVLGVFVAEADEARFTELPQAQEGQPAPTDLSPDTLIIGEGRHSLIDGSPIEIQP
jgi:RND family efflux transporter MFP subunit